MDDPQLYMGSVVFVHSAVGCGSLLILAVANIAATIVGVPVSVGYSGSSSSG
jgi:hypothetical protein